MIYRLLYERATTHAGLSALIGTRCYAVQRSQGVTAASVVIQQISGRETSQQGCVGEQRWQLMLYAPTYSAVKLLAVQVKLAFDRWSDGDGTYTIKWMRRVNEADMPFDEVNRQYRVLIDYMVNLSD